MMPKSSPEKLAAVKMWRQNNKERASANSLRWAAKNQERTRENQREWVKKNREHLREYKRAWKSARLNRTVVPRGESKLSASREYNVVKCAKRRARKAMALGRGVTKVEWENALKMSCRLCVYCCSSIDLTMDHIESLKHGGTHDASNITVACRRCNGSKADRKLLLWLAFRRRSR